METQPEPNLALYSRPLISLTTLPELTFVSFLSHQPSLALNSLHSFTQTHARFAHRYCFRGFTRLLNNVHESNNTYLPGSVSGIESYQELLILLWRFLEESPNFVAHILDNKDCDVNDLVVPICYLMYEARLDANRVGLVHICTFILLKLSGEREFGVQVRLPHTCVDKGGGRCELRDGGVREERPAKAAVSKHAIQSDRPRTNGESALFALNDRVETRYAHSTLLVFNTRFARAAEQALQHAPAHPAAALRRRTQRLARDYDAQAHY